MSVSNLEERICDVLFTDRWMHQRDIAKAARMCTARTWTTLQQLVAAGEVEPSELQSTGGRRPVVYRLAMRHRKETAA